MAKSVPAIFLDRDGTINVDHGYVHEIDEFEFIEGAIDAMRQLKEMGYALVVVTNQSGIARGKFTEAQFETLSEWMDWSLADRGVDLDGIYYCPHHPQGTVEEYRQTCDCRKPHPGMFISAQEFLHIDMAASYMVGDKLEGFPALPFVQLPIANDAKHPVWPSCQLVRQRHTARNGDTLSQRAGGGIHPARF